MENRVNPIYAIKATIFLSNFLAKTKLTTSTFSMSRRINHNLRVHTVFFPQCWASCCHGHKGQGIMESFFLGTPIPYTWNLALQTQFQPVTKPSNFGSCENQAMISIIPLTNYLQKESLAGLRQRVFISHIKYHECHHKIKRR